MTSRWGRLFVHLVGAWRWTTSLSVLVTQVQLQLVLRLHAGADPAAAAVLLERPHTQDVLFYYTPWYYLPHINARGQEFEVLVVNVSLLRRTSCRTCQLML